MAAKTPPVVEARAVLSGEDDTKRSSTLEEICASRRADLEAAEVELAKHRSQIAEYVIPDEAELNALVLAIEQDIEGHLASDKPFVRKLATAIDAHCKAQQALTIAEEAVRDVDLTPPCFSSMPLGNEDNRHTTWHRVVTW